MLGSFHQAVQAVILSNLALFQYPGSRQYPPKPRVVRLSLSSADTQALNSDFSFAFGSFFIKSIVLGTFERPGASAAGVS